MSLLVRFVEIFTSIMIAAIFIRAVLSWFMLDPRNPLVNALDQITEPILEPLRRVVPRLGMIDITPMVAILILILIQRLVASYA
ncbi:MAG: YggT family protein [Dehalococcoidia bacterium]|nr:YggT family protein [Dehalococcoidia bacterium]